MGRPKEKKYSVAWKDAETALFVNRELKYAFVPECFKKDPSLFYIVRVNLKTNATSYMRVDPTKEDSPRATFREYESWEAVYDLYNKAKQHYVQRNRH